jgi:hypothetical protein
MFLVPSRLLGAAGASLVLASSAAHAGDGGRLLLESRLRYEFVDQAGLPENAHAVTLRHRVGVETPARAGWKLLLEIEYIEALLEDYNDGVSGDPRRPVVADVETFELNRAQLSWKGAVGQEAVLGRQEIVLNNQRFMGPGAWRQNEQTFDAVRVSAPVGPAKLTYAYVDRVLRGATRTNRGERESETHLAQAEMKTPAGALSAYALLIELDDLPGDSAATYGARLTGSRKAGAGDLVYVVEYARQTDHADNPAGFELDYLALEGGVKRGTTTLTANLERLGGNGRTGLRTTLGSRHSPQGWSDAIGDTPANGLLDLNVKAVTSWKGFPVGDGLRFEARAYHFSDEGGGLDFGRELNASLGTKLNKHLSAELKAARFEGEVPAYADRTKFWVSTELKF